MTDADIREIAWSTGIIALTIEMALDAGDTAQAKESAGKIRAICDALVRKIDAKKELEEAKKEAGR